MNDCKTVTLRTRPLKNRMLSFPTCDHAGFHHYITKIPEMNSFAQKFISGIPIRILFVTVSSSSYSI